ncbi:N/A [soil metagenome]
MQLEVLDYAFMQRALWAALLVGLAAPSVGIYLVQRRLSLIGDGLGHVALTGVAVGLVTSRSPVWTALVAAAIGAVAIELVRARGRTSGDVALAVLFYGGLAGGVVVVSHAPAGTTVNLDTYLFGAITTTTTGDLRVFLALTVLILVVTHGFGRYLFSVSNDEEYALASGLPVLRLNVLLAVVTSVTVVVSMRVVGLLLISALMVIPVATAQLLTRSFRSTVLVATALATLASVSGVGSSYYLGTPSGGTIVLIALAAFMVVAAAVAARERLVGAPHRQPVSEAEERNEVGALVDEAGAVEGDLPTPPHAPAPPDPRAPPADPAQPAQPSGSGLG